jgi:glyoxylase-like metal-dependent hydrolase (beta-lactamase superfamily II)
LVHVYLLLEAGKPTLIDTGSGYGDANSQVLSGLAEVRSEFGEPIDLADIRRIIITHGHIDHFGGLPLLHERTGAEIAIHELDRRILVANQERVVVATRALKHYLQQAGVPTALRPAMMEMYSFSK